MNNEINLEREFIESIIGELEETIDIICPCPQTWLATENVCNACKLEKPCSKLHKVAVTLRYTL